MATGIPAANTPRESPAHGFDGTVTCSSLVDVIQFNVHNRFSGCLGVQHGPLRGRVFFSDGGIVHAQQGDEGGERAFFEIMGWPAGHFCSEAHAGEVERTIDRDWQQLVLDGCRLIDENRARRTFPQASETAAIPRPADELEALRRSPGVVHAIVQRPRDTSLQGSREARLLACDGRYLVFFGRQLGSIIGAGEVVVAVVRRSRDLVLLCASEDGLVAVLARASETGSTDEVLASVVAKLGEGRTMTVEPPLGDAQQLFMPVGTMECDTEGQVTANGLPESCGTAMVREAALLVANGMDALDDASGTADSIDFRYRHARLVVTRSAGGFSMTLCSGSARVASRSRASGMHCATVDGRREPSRSASFRAGGEVA